METLPKYRGIPYESDSELYFLFWLFEVSDKYQHVDIKRGETFSITKGFIMDYPEVKKGKPVMKKQTILKPSVYTPDYVITGLGGPFQQMIIGPKNVKYDDDGVSYEKEMIYEKITKPLLSGYIFDFPITYIECKPDFDQNNMTRLFKINQKMMWDKHQIFVNLVKTNEFFEKTFTPEEYLKTRTGKPRKLNYRPRTLNEYLDGQHQETRESDQGRAVEDAT